MASSMHHQLLPSFLSLEVCILLVKAEAAFIQSVLNDYACAPIVTRRTRTPDESESAETDSQE